MGFLPRSLMIILLLMIILFCGFSKYELVTSDDLWSVMQDIVDTTSWLKRFDVKKVMDTSITQKRFSFGDRNARLHKWKRDNFSATL